MTAAADSASRGRRENRIEPWMANRIWRVLIEECGFQGEIRGYDHYCFVTYLDDEHWSGHEYRFQGALGFGGKFYNNCGRWWVGCYPENRTPERDEMIRRANERIGDLRAEYND